MKLWVVRTCVVRVVVFSQKTCPGTPLQHALAVCLARDLSRKRPCNTPLRCVYGVFQGRVSGNPLQHALLNDLRCSGLVLLSV